MRIPRIAALILPALLVLSACAREPQETTATATLPDGTVVASVSGSGVEFSMELTTTTVPRGERLPLRLVLRNTSDESLDKPDHTIAVYFDRSEDGANLGSVSYSNTYGSPPHPLHLRSQETTTIEWWATADWGSLDADPPDEVFVRAAYQGMFTPYIKVDIE